VLHVGARGFVQSVLVRQPTHAPVDVSQIVPAAAVPPPPPSRAQLVLVRHWTHRMVEVLQ
jgi:hypothetical protein